MYVNTTGNDDTGNGTAENPYLTIKNGIANVNQNGTIKIANGTYNGINNTNIIIDKNLNIIGESQTGTIIDGENNNWIFNTTTNTTVNIRSITFINGKTGFQGGAISNYGNCTLDYCTFINNSAESGVGGAIYDHYGNITVNNSKFTGNNAYGAGAIGSAGGFINLSNCIFTGNNAYNDGGAVYGNIKSVTGCSFIDNNAFRGGAIFSSGDCTILNCVFTGNTASYGGAIMNYNIMDVHFNRFYNNSGIGSDIYNKYMQCKINAVNNWWGSNADPKSISNVIMGYVNEVNTNDWIILSVNALPNNIKNTKNSTITADFNHINGGSELTGGCIPDGPITLHIPWGSFINSGITQSVTINTFSGAMNAIFYANEGAVPTENPVKVTATADNYTTNDTESTYILIKKTSDLYLKITSNNHNPKVGQKFTIIYKLGNKGPDEANNVIIIIPLPEGFEYTDINGDGDWTYNTATKTLTWALTSVSNGDPYLYITGRANKSGTYVFTSSISSDNYNINTQGVTPITINVVSEVKASIKTVRMQNTGLPIAGLILAILAVFGGLVSSKRK